MRTRRSTSRGWRATSALRKSLINVDLRDGSGHCQFVVIWKELCEESDQAG